MNRRACGVAQYLVVKVNLFLLLYSTKIVIVFSSQLNLMENILFLRDNVAAIQCPLPVAPLNGRIGGTNINQRRLTVGALITFSCNEGHTLVGEPSIICTESGFWSHPPPFCK